VVCDDSGRPLLLHLSEGQANDHKTAAAVIEHLPPSICRLDVMFLG
jgi:putative transposase